MEKKLFYLTVIYIGLFFICQSFVGAQQQNRTIEAVPMAEHQKIKDILVEYTIHCNDLEKENMRLINYLNGLTKELKEVEDIEGLDGVLKNYGIERNRDGE